MHARTADFECIQNAFNALKLISNVGISFVFARLLALVMSECLNNNSAEKIY